MQQAICRLPLLTPHLWLSRRCFGLVQSSADLGLNKVRQISASRVQLAARGTCRSVGSRHRGGGGRRQAAAAAGAVPGPRPARLRWPVTCWSSAGQLRSRSVLPRGASLPERASSTRASSTRARTRAVRMIAGGCVREVRRRWNARGEAHPRPCQRWRVRYQQDAALVTTFPSPPNRSARLCNTSNASSRKNQEQHASKERRGCAGWPKCGGDWTAVDEWQEPVNSSRAGASNSTNG